MSVHCCFHSARGRLHLDTTGAWNDEFSSFAANDCIEGRHVWNTKQRRDVLIGAGENISLVNVDPVSDGDWNTNSKFAECLSGSNSSMRFRTGVLENLDWEAALLPDLLDFQCPPGATYVLRGAGVRHQNKGVPPSRACATPGA